MKNKIALLVGVILTFASCSTTEEIVETSSPVLIVDKAENDTEVILRDKKDVSEVKEKVREKVVSKPEVVEKIKPKVISKVENKVEANSILPALVKVKAPTIFAKKGESIINLVLDPKKVDTVLDFESLEEQNERINQSLEEKVAVTEIKREIRPETIATAATPVKEGSKKIYIILLGIIAAISGFIVTRKKR